MPPTQTDEGLAIAAILRTLHPEMGVLLWRRTRISKETRHGESWLGDR
jgi:hypothetical protein